MEANSREDLQKSSSSSEGKCFFQATVSEFFLFIDKTLLIVLSKRRPGVCNSAEIRNMIMARILIWKQIAENSSLDFINQSNYNTLYRTVVSREGIGANFGNKVWLQGIYSEVNTKENTVVIRTNESADYINDFFDLVIYPMANFFCVEYCSDTKELVESIKDIRIPIYVIACGIKTKNEDDIEELVSRIKDPASRFIEAVVSARLIQPFCAG